LKEATYQKLIKKYPGIEVFYGERNYHDSGVRYYRRKADNERKYTQEETDYIKANYFKMKSYDIDTHLGLIRGSAARKMCVLHLRYREIPEDVKKSIITLAMPERNLTMCEIVALTGLSYGRINKILKVEGIIRKRVYKYCGWSRNRPLLKDFKCVGRNKVPMQIRYSYNNTCWDCKKEVGYNLTPRDYSAIHHDFTKLPIQVFLLCSDCHKKRHEVLNHNIAEAKP